MPYIDEWQPADPLQVLVYGVSKVGKTVGALTFPRPVVFDFDRGVASARSKWFTQRYGQRKVFYDVFIERDIVKGIPRTHNAFDDACRFFDEWMKPAGKWKTYDVGVNMFDTWIIDSGTTLSEIAQYKAILVLGKMKLSQTSKDADTHGVLVPRIQDYGSERSLVEQFIDMVKGSGKNVVLLCHEKELTTESGAVTGIVPLLTGKSVESVPLKFDEVYNLRIVREGPNFARKLLTEADGIRKVGSRYGIPNNTEWSWDALHTKLQEIKKSQLTQTKKE